MIALGAARCRRPIKIGRQHELRALVVRLRQPHTRLVTLSGAAGAGKTALALAVAADPTLTKVFPDGVYVVDLTIVSTPASVPGAIGEVLGLGESTTPQAHVTDYLRELCALLVMDNFEHVLAAGLMVADILAACPGVKVLATSRATLRLRDETLIPVLPLPLPLDGAGSHPGTTRGTSA